MTVVDTVLLVFLWLILLINKEVISSTLHAIMGIIDIEKDVLSILRKHWTL